MTDIAKDMSTAHTHIRRGSCITYISENWRHLLHEIHSEENETAAHRPFGALRGGINLLPYTARTLKRHDGASVITGAGADRTRDRHEPYYNIAKNDEPHMGIFCAADGCEKSQYWLASKKSIVLPRLVQRKRWVLGNNADLPGVRTPETDSGMGQISGQTAASRADLGRPVLIRREAARPSLGLLWVALSVKLLVSAQSLQLWARNQPGKEGATSCSRPQPALYWGVRLCPTSGDSRAKRRDILYYLINPFTRLQTDTRQWHSHTVAGALQG
ncbi:hypothetical protein C8R45DRAFT_941639 [Mycena sanguinolenta]|nr:hypothetical protein C8R45DRAFT_941639 [Mycena sanguinolenta]